MSVRNSDWRALSFASTNGSVTIAAVLAASSAFDNSPLVNYNNC